MFLTFHIIYVPGSVVYLLPFVSTLLRWSDCRFRLVANGCTTAEVALLQARCADEPRLELLALSTDRPLSHYQALNYLQAQCQEEHFCFLDSDILATGPFMATIEPLVGSHTGLFAGAPLWMRPGDRVFQPGYDVICGEHDRTVVGVPLGGTFFAVYDNRTLTDLIHCQGFGFEMRSWQQLPTPLQAWCAERGLAGPRHFYDTGKALNLSLQQQGYAVTVVDSPQLLHLGGLSFIAKRNWYDAQRGIVGIYGDLYRMARAIYIDLRRRINDEPVNRSRKLPFGRRRRIYGPYFTAVLAVATAGRRPPPQPAEHDPIVRMRAAAASAAVMTLFEAEKRGQLPIREHV
ncbi:hypothetical protein [Candidatus Chloroploca sp. Khr17]|uniref:hypothetical protein n=1 Tax=Candidatus Chloroploca sp. Khr17 TaxID=2496869 RepID=UPI00101CF2D3|nr:hypothetical protein [Candidatus Chloroploca sp. Khr17]